MASRGRSKWTAAEDALLRSMVAQYGSKRGRGANNRWRDISLGLPGRTSKDCRKRWFHSIDPSLRKGRWTESEDRTLLEAYARLGPAWKEIACLIPGRKDDQCSKRYNEVLSPEVKGRLNDWTPEEDEYLTQKVSEFGHRWAAIAADLPGRPPLTCRNRWRALYKQQQNSQNGRQTDLSPSSSSPTNLRFDTDSDYYSSSLDPSQDLFVNLLDNSWGSVPAAQLRTEDNHSLWDLDTSSLSMPESDLYESSHPTNLGSATIHTNILPSVIQGDPPLDEYHAPTSRLLAASGTEFELPLSQDIGNHYMADIPIASGSEELHSISEVTRWPSASSGGVVVTHVYHHHHIYHHHVYHNPLQNPQNPTM